MKCSPLTATRLIALATACIASCSIDVPALQGDAGPPGPEGDQGQKGDTGEKGDQGDAGTPGPEGDQGQKGDTGEKGDEGDAGPPCDVSVLAEHDKKLAALEARVKGLEEAQCPRGSDWKASIDGSALVCTRSFEGASDVVVKVGDFWLDRYEASLCGAGDVGDKRGFSATAAACSTPGAKPGDSPPKNAGELLRSVTWFQAEALCANAGKALCTNAQWQTAVSGTLDQGSFPDGNPSDGCSGAALDTYCNTCSSGPAKAGFAQKCVSRFGAFDMIGNLWEWVADWHQAGRTANPFSEGQYRAPWPSGYSSDNADGTWNVDGRAYGEQGSTDGLVGAGIRGGGWSSAADAGAFALYLGDAPSAADAGIGLRCCLGGM